MIVVGLSGGVDSAVAALRLRQQGYEIEGLFMANWEEADAYCTIAADYQDALAVCRELGIPLHRVDFAAEYRQRVFDYFLTEYRAGRTPNPDVLCNREIKFKVFAEYAASLGAARIATGHYARLARAPDGSARLLKGLDAGKDQSYFLHAVPGEQLARCLFPVGELPKREVRRIATEAGFPVAAKKDSTGICFIGERRFADFLKRYLPAAPGEIHSAEGELLGRHHGLMYYTLGQRQGIGIGGVRGHAEEPWYVVDKDLARNVLVVGQGAAHPRLLSTGLRFGELHWISAPPAGNETLGARIRYRQADQSCRLRYLGGNRAELRFAEPQRAVTPGQYAVLYRGEECLGGGVIEERIA